MTAAAYPVGHRDNEDVVLLPFARSHLEGALKLSQEMSWPYRIEDWDVALQLGHGFVLERAGTVIGTAAWWPYGETHASAGMIIVAKTAPRATTIPMRVAGSTAQRSSLLGNGTTDEPPSCSARVIPSGKARV